MKQIAEHWDNAKAQLEELREAVTRTGELANLKVHSSLMSREKDKALRDFGEAIWSAVQKGKLQLPPSLSGAAKAMQEVERRLHAQSMQINDLLAEGAEVAEKMKKSTKPKAASKTMLAPRGRKV